MTVIGPFDEDDWYTMGQLKKALAHARKSLKDTPEFPFAEKDILKDLRKYMTREAA